MKLLLQIHTDTYCYRYNKNFKMSIQDLGPTEAIHRHLKKIVVYLKFIVKFQILTTLKFLHVFTIYSITMKTE